jgi:hypothetical protein
MDASPEQKREVLEDLVWSIVGSRQFSLQSLKQASCRFRKTAPPQERQSSPQSAGST